MTTFQSVFPDLDINSYIKRIFIICNNRKQNPLCNNEITHKHHIIPKFWYKYNDKYPDETKYNLVKLTPLEHFTVHYLMIEYYRSTGQTLYFNASIMAFYVLRNNKDIISIYADLKKQFPDIENIFIQNNQEAIQARSFLSQYYWQHLSPEKKNEFSVSIKRGWALMPDKKRKQHSERLRENYKNMSDAEKEKLREHRIAGLRKAWAEKPNSEKQKNNDHLKQVNKQWRESLTEAEKKEFSDKVKNGLSKISAERRQDITKKWRQSYQCKSAEQKQIEHNNRSNAAKQNWKNLSDEKKIELSKQRSLLAKQRWAIQKQIGKTHL